MNRRLLYTFTIHFNVFWSSKTLLSSYTWLYRFKVKSFFARKSFAPVSRGAILNVLDRVEVNE